MQRIHFIINPISGRKKKPQATIRAIGTYFPGLDFGSAVTTTRGPGDATRIAVRAVEAGSDMVVAVGGDGTVNEVARALIGSTCALGVVPGGSGNGFARNFGMPLGVDKALQALCAPAVVPLDVGFINGNPFFNVAGFGLDAEICFAYEQFGRRGPLPYFWLAVQKFFRHRPETVTFRHERGRETVRSMLFSIANLPQYGSGAVIAPMARGNDGLLDVCILEPLPVWQALVNAPRLFNRTIHHMNRYRTFPTKSLEILREKAGAIHVDGNPLREDARLCLEVRPQALRVACPAVYGRPVSTIPTGIRPGSG
jgi:diacylglycerol kinase (ATP)